MIQEGQVWANDTQKFMVPGFELSGHTFLLESRK